MLFDEVKEIIAEQLSVDEDKIEMDVDLVKDLEADSLDVVELIMGLEEKFDIEIPDDDLKDIKTVRDIVEYIENRK